MDFDVYCDESSPEVLNNRYVNDFLVLGSIWIPKDYRDTLKNTVKEIKRNNNYRNEMKWNKVSPSSFDFYSEIVDYFFSTDDIRFRGIVVDAKKVDMVRFHNDDSELSFYKFYYQLLHHWILDYNEYNIFLDYKVNKDVNRVENLKNTLSNANLFANIKNVQSLESKQSIGIQLADLFTGVLNGKFNSKIKSESKINIINQIEQHIGHEIRKTWRTENQFNVFKINLEGGW